jgi:hypothetical protein
LTAKKQEETHQDQTQLTLSHKHASFV